jgi:hypothetical protein
MYTIRADAHARIVRAELSGFFSQEEVAAFARDEQAAAMSLGCGAGQFGLLICAPGGTAQAQDVIRAFQGLLQNAPLKSGCIALVCESALLKMQLRRIVPAERATVFDTEGEAIRWLKARLGELQTLAEQLPA